jgi:vitamin B12 transporter
MQIGAFRKSRTVAAFLAILPFYLYPCLAHANPTAELRVTVVDPLGAVVPKATVVLLRDNNPIAHTATSGAGEFSFSSLKPGRYRVRASAAGFLEQNSPTVYVGSGGKTELTVSLKLGTVAQQVVVSATGSPIPDSQVGASVSTVARNELESKLDVSAALRTTVEIQVLQTGQHGGTTDIFVRGANANANKVLVDGIPINNIGGAVEFGNLGTTGIQQVEILRGPNSVLYGADALAGVINLTTAEGATSLPEISYSIDGGNFNTKQQDVSIGGARAEWDYFSEFSRLDTGNSEPNSAFHNGTYAGNFGWASNRSTQLRFTLRHTAAELGLANALDVFGMPDDSFQEEQDSYFGVTAENQTTNRWHNLVRYGATRLRFQFDNPGPTGEPFDPFGSGANFLGNPVTLVGANGFTTSGQAILDFAGVYPSLFSSQTNRDFVYTQSDYKFNRHLSGLFSFRYEQEDGSTLSAGTKTPANRNNFDYAFQLEGNLWERLYATLGVGLDDNAVFGVKPTPRLSLAYYVVRLRQSGFFNGTKLRFNFGDGIKEPAIFDQSTSLFNLLSELPNGSQLISQFHVQPIGAERSRSYDFGVDESLWNGRAKLALTGFHNQFSDQIEFVDPGVLPQLGVPAAVVAAAPFGASVNSGAFRTLGAESELELNFGHGLITRGSYTYLDGRVQQSFVSSTLMPAFNPAFPGIPIGSTPLIGNRPFRRAPDSGSFLIAYSQPRFTLSFDGNLVGRRDDSTHAIDAFFANTLLLPNRNLDAAYQKLDCSGSYRLNSLIQLHASFENILSQHYDAAFGFPSLPFTFRAGMKFTLGGESWKRL